MIMKDKSEKIIGKIKKALALAADTKSPDEAQAAMMAAQRLMAKHNIDMSEVEDSEDSDGKRTIQTHITDPTGRIPWWKKRLARIIADNFRCEYFISRLGKFNSVLTYLGLEDDVAIGKSVYTYAESVMDRQAKLYVQKYYREKKPTKGVRNKFIEGFLSGLSAKFDEQVSQNDWGLVLTTDALVVEELETLGLRTVKSTGVKPKFSSDQNAWEEGYKQGQNFADTDARTSIE
jgi:Protein of unknown function (DUF2786)